ncbi:ATPase, T2SS/T4P/T4SS family [Gordoniibacillus kamchatkensis]|uniref:ATPase, T2SS/T4P/T4SS family n=1 Tax=Gordoniibacillus kamchatkensis TaxID=1590651 RepID=UPI00069845B2|nr:ATPase, T2SS/T4P/T4SS family [Paenibacillus sp. VKM B-2647]
MNERKFSVTVYADRWRGTGHDRTLWPTGIERPDSEGRSDFASCVAEIRGELVAGLGGNDEERQRFGETLNRAILGYDQERRQLLAVIQDLIARKRMTILPPPTFGYTTLAEAIFAELIGMGALEVILKQREGLEEIQVVGCDVFEVRKGRPTLSSIRLGSVKELERIQQNLVLFNNETFNPRKRWAEVRLRDGSRVTMTGFGFTAQPTLTIRFYTMRHYGLSALAEPEFCTVDGRMADLLRAILRAEFNLVIIGPTNSGKTNLMKALIAELDDDERIITIESRFELMLKRDFPDKNIVEYEVDEDDRKHSGEQAFKLALRQSPKRIVHAEIRDEDANLYVRACTRGHEGSMTTVHVNELEDAPDAITDMCMLDGRGMNSERLTKRITEYVTQIGLEMAIVGGNRKLVRIGEYVYEQGEVVVRDIVRYDEGKGEWEWPEPFSARASERFGKRDQRTYRKLLQMGVVTA